jgi:centromere/kinetochore protein ZW10
MMPSPTPDHTSTALLSYLQSSAIPSESTLSAPLVPSSLPTILSALEAARSQILKDVRSDSKHLGGDVDSWIAQARQLQTDVINTKSSAHTVVELHKAMQDAGETVHDKQASIALLRKEVTFNEALADQLEALAVATGLIDSARSLLAENDVRGAVDKLGQADKVRLGIEREGRGARVVEVLRRRGEIVRGEVGEAVRLQWGQLVKIDSGKKSVVVTQERGDGPGLEQVVHVLGDLGILEHVVGRFHRDFDALVIAPRIIPKSDGSIAKIEVGQDSIRVVGRQIGGKAVDMIRDVYQLINFLHRVFPKSVSTLLLDQILPTLILHLVSGWLDPSLPLELDDLEPFKEVTAEVQKLAEFVNTQSVNIPSEANLETWLKKIPQNWVARRKEKALLDMRTQCYEAVRVKQTAEKVETQIVDSDDAMFGDKPQEENAEKNEEDEWGEDWGENEEDEQHTDKKSKTEPEAEQAQEEAEGDDWGWGDEAEDPSSPVKTKSKSSAPTSKPKSTAQKAEPKPITQKEITLRETYTTTAIPSTIITLLTTLLSDATTLKSPSFSLPPLVPATNALATIPTLILAFYRATAHSYYATDPASNMLIYNDTQNLVTLLTTSFLPSIPPTHPLATRVRLDADISALATFSRRAYSREMDAQRTVVRDMLSSAAGFVNVTAPLNRKQYAETVADAMRRVRDMDKAWRAVLSDSARLQSLGSLVSVLAGQLVADVLERADDMGGISEEASKLLKMFVDKIGDLQDLFQDGERNGVYIYTPGWLRFVYLGEILEASLADIRYLWSEGELSLEFEANEVIDLIMALFAESSHRKEAIWVIKSGGRA